MKYFLALFACFLCIGASASAQEQFFLDNSAAPGCGNVTVPGYKGQSTVESFSMSGARPSTPGTKVQLSDLVVHTSVNKCSSVLLADFLTGQVIPTLTLTEVKTLTGSAGTSSPVVLTITLHNALVDSYNISTSGTGQQAAEEVAYKYQSASIVAHQIDPATGNPTAALVKLYYDAEQNIVSIGTGS